MQFSRFTQNKWKKKRNWKNIAVYITELLISIVQVDRVHNFIALVFQLISINKTLETCYCDIIMTVLPLIGLRFFSASEWSPV